MAGRFVRPPRPVAVVQVPTVDDPATDRALDVIGDAVADLRARRERFAAKVSLVVGTNKVRHGLGRACLGYTITPTVLDAALAHRIDRTNPRPDLEVWIELSGSAQPDAVVEVY
jgi:hypothetical protein